MAWRSREFDSPWVHQGAFSLMVERFLYTEDVGVRFPDRPLYKLDSKKNKTTLALVWFLYFVGAEGQNRTADT